MWLIWLTQFWQIKNRTKTIIKETISRERVMDSAKDLCRIINQSVENDDLLKGKKSIIPWDS